MLTSFRVSGNRISVLVDGAIKQRLDLRVDPFFDRISLLPSDRGLDLLRIAAGVYAIDRIQQRNFRSDDFGVRCMAVKVEVRQPDFWMNPVIVNQLESILAFLTGDMWSLTFEGISASLQGDEYQGHLEWRAPQEVDRIALYSGGLDSSAGLASRLIRRDARYGLLTVRHQAGLKLLCEKQIDAIPNLLGTAEISTASVVVGLRKGKAARLDSQERTQRSRTFFFCAVAAVMARAHEVKDIDVFENGVGAVNFPLMTGMLMGAFATKGSHPTFLREMSSFCEKVMDSEMSFHLPFGDMTKGEMLKSLRDHGLDAWLSSSRSCVHTSMRVKGIQHCGVCPACIERRQAFSIAGIEDETAYQVGVFSDPPISGTEAAYFRLYREEAAAWLARRPSALRRMEWHLQLTDVPADQRERIGALWTRHSREVIEVFGDTPAGALVRTKAAA